MIEALSSASCTVVCASDRHHLVWRDGTLEAFDHPDPERERALTALGGDRYRCLELLEVWQRYREDLDVLVLGSRGVQDPILTGSRGEDGHGHVHGGRQGWYSYSGGYGSMSTMRHSHRPPTVGLRDVLRLGGGVAERLSAEVIATWSRRVADGTVDREAVPRLHAALYGRFAAALRAWLGDRDLQIGVVMTAPGTPATVERDEKTVRAGLPFAWLAEVWAPGLAVVADRLVLSARRTAPGRIELGTLDRGLTRSGSTTLEMRDS